MQLTAKSRRVQILRFQQMANTLQRQGRSTRLVERRSYCTDKLLAGWKLGNARDEHCTCSVGGANTAPR